MRRNYPHRVVLLNRVGEKAVGPGHCSLRLASVSSAGRCALPTAHSSLSPPLRFEKTAKLRACGKMGRKSHSVAFGKSPHGRICRRYPPLPHICFIACLRFAHAALQSPPATCSLPSPPTLGSQRRFSIGQRRSEAGWRGQRYLALAAPRAALPLLRLQIYL